MGWAIGWDENHKRDVGYGVPAHCDHPGCHRVIDRGLAYVCGGEPYGGEEGCGLYFCERHLGYAVDEKEDGNWKLSGPQQCERCLCGEPPFEPKPDHKKWIHWKMTDWSWTEWRKENGLPEPKRMRKPKPDELGLEILATGTFKEQK